MMTATGQTSSRATSPFQLCQSASTDSVASTVSCRAAQTPGTGVLEGSWGSLLHLFGVCQTHVLNGPHQRHSQQQMHSRHRVFDLQAAACTPVAAPRYEEDIALAKEAHCNAFRLSIEWARVEPQRGVIDQEAVAR